MGEMVFKSKVLDSFNKIKDDFSRVERDISKIHGEREMFKNELKDISSSIRGLGDVVNSLARKIDILEPFVVARSVSNEKDPLVSYGTSPKEEGIEVRDVNRQVIGLKSSEQVINNAGKSPKKNPLVSTGTSSIGNLSFVKDSKRAGKTKREICLIKYNEQLVTNVYNDIVITNELCSKTTFYRFIKELELTKHVEIYLFEGKRFLKILNPIL